MFLASESNAQKPSKILETLRQRTQTRGILPTDSYLQQKANWQNGITFRDILLSSLWVSRTGSASDWCALQEAQYKCIYTIQHKSYGATYADIRL